jgi:hypothetical protein
MRRIGQRSVESEIISKIFQHQSIPAGRKHKFRMLRSYNDHLWIVSDWRYSHFVGVAANDPGSVNVGDRRLPRRIESQGTDNTRYNTNLNVVRRVVQEITPKYNKLQLANWQLNSTGRSE